MDVYLLNVFIFNSPNERKEIFKQYSTIYLTPSVSYYKTTSFYFQKLQKKGEVSSKVNCTTKLPSAGILSASIIINNLHLGGGSVSLPKFSDGCVGRIYYPSSSAARTSPEMIKRPRQTPGSHGNVIVLRENKENKQLHYISTLAILRGKYFLQGCY